LTEAFFEKLNNFYYRLLVPEKKIASEKSEYQQIDIVETKDGNKALILDGTIQLYTGDEFIYHEMVVHLPFIHHPNPEKVLVLGGGDGFLAREALKYNSLKEIVEFKCGLSLNFKKGCTECLKDFKGFSDEFART